MTNILLTGSGGFIGSHLKNFLCKNYTLFTPRSDELDLLDKKAIDSFVVSNQVDFIVHCAAKGTRINTSPTMDEVAKSNILMFQHLSKHVSGSCPMIVLGSGAEYDKSYPIVNVKEDDFGKSIPSDPYGYSKYVISKEIEKTENILNLRLFGVYGKGENPSRVTSCILNDVINKKDIELNQNVRFSFIYIDDLCKIIEYFVQNFPEEKFINVAHPDTITIKELAEIANNISDSHSSILFRYEGMNKEYTADASLLQGILKNFEFTSYECGMKTFYEVLKNEK